MRCRSARKIEHHFLDVTPAPPFRRIIGLDDRVPGRVKMFCCVPIWRLITAPDMAAGTADPQMQPRVTRFQTFLFRTNDFTEREARGLEPFVTVFECKPCKLSISETIEDDPNDRTLQ